MERGQSWREPRSYESEASPALLFVDADAPSPSDRKRATSSARLGPRGEDEFSLPDPRRLNFLLLDYDQESRTLAESAAQRRATDAETLDWVNHTSSIELLPPGDLPANPVGLSAVDVVFIPLEDLRTLAADHPDRMASLSHHIQAGASLIVYGGGDQFEGLPEVERLLGIRPDVFSKGDSAWQAADPSDYGQNVSTFTAFLRQYGQVWTPPGLEVEDDTNDQRPVKPGESVPVEQRANFRLRDHGLGTVVVIDAQDPFQQEPLFWHWVLRTLGTNRWLWQKRHGMSLQSNNDDFWQFLIPGVGAAPVKSFLATIALFVIVIGPVNFFLLKRIKRLYLLPLTVPLAAAVTTVLMIAYALVSDGLSTRMRLRSFTYIDQPGDTTVCWSRQAYYAAQRPPVASRSRPTAASIHWNLSRAIRNRKCDVATSRTMTRS